MPSTPAERLRERIRREGAIPFAVFMEEALYGEGGYYAREWLAIGEDGDFVTGSSHSPLFGQTTAELLRRLDRELGRAADCLEAGYGSGAHLRAVMAASDRDRRWLACDRIAREVPAGVEASTEIGRWPEGSIDGLIFSYELFDALPVHRLIRAEDGLRELGVGLEQGGNFAWREMQLSNPALEALVPVELELGQIADVADWATAYAEVARRLGCGLIVTFDYGYPAERLFDPRVRRNGTLACYRRQRVHRDPFVDVGGQDLTAHVDLTALVRAGESLGLETVVLTRQAPWLAALGILDGLAGRPARERVAAMQLLDLEGMGEDLRVLVQGRGVDAGHLLDRSLFGAVGS
jgi:SAM-dependent MidA family methyltransferase